MTNQTIHPCPKCEVVPEVDLCYTPTSVVVCCQLHPAYSVDTVLWADLCDLHLGRACRELGIETVEQLKAKVQPDPRVAVLLEKSREVCEWKRPDRFRWETGCGLTIGRDTDKTRPCWCGRRVEVKE